MSGINPQFFPASTWERATASSVSTFETLNHRISKNIQANPCGFTGDSKKGPLNKCAKFEHGIRQQMRLFENSQFFKFSSKCRFLKFKTQFLQGMMGKI